MTRIEKLQLRVKLESIRDENFSIEQINCAAMALCASRDSETGLVDDHALMGLSLVMQRHIEALEDLVEDMLAPLPSLSDSARAESPEPQPDLRRSA